MFAKASNIFYISNFYTQQPKYLNLDTSANLSKFKHKLQTAKPYTKIEIYLIIQLHTHTL